MATTQPLQGLSEGDRLIVGGDRFVTVSANLAAAFQPGDRVVVEGIADLVFETAGGELVVVDYKTDRTLTDSSKAHYAEQLACYGELVQRVTGRPVGRRVVVHVPSNSATEYLF